MPRIIDADRPAIAAIDDDAFADADALAACPVGPLPATLVRRMMEHVAAYAVVLTSGVTVYIDVLHGVVAAADGGLWLEAHLLQHGPDGAPNPHPFKAASGDVLINAGAIAAAFEVRQ